ncbi:winged helix-turn-helix domain-containing protein [Epilithonimonas zeae]|uniref:winged helix-turn-helix domain-containing protein n=1 Tax=Epilithonimonas zeae TaxID=1416779 RepID=UPI00200D26C9|nr:crosslink repair DNA glycosylase YcaQ family protein [Epilithonimonas zeae]UQB67276.1 YcaQ family DNA glycosylase [Epilithonimonas zeae]
MTEKLTLSQLRFLTLESQGLTKSYPFGKGKDAVLKALERLGYLQIDTLSIVERAHHHTLWTRIPDYKTEYLEELAEERKLFEYWFHAASYLPMKDFRFALPRMLEVKQSETHYYNADPKVMKYVLDTIRYEGPKKAKDFENETQKSGSWWSWKPTKIALERLFLQGDLMISSRKGMQKTYDLTENVLPQTINTIIPTDLEFAEYLVKTYLNGYGFTTTKQITHLKKGELIRKNIDKVLKSMLEEGTIQQVNIENTPPVFVQKCLLERTNKKISNIRLLSPFDNSIIHRDRIKQFFDFDYKIECYIPKEKRQFGYFCLPILFGDTFIGRVDCKAHRKEKVFELIHLHIETTNIDIELWKEQFMEVLKSFAIFNGCEHIKLTKVNPTKLTKLLT